MNVVRDAVSSFGRRARRGRFETIIRPLLDQWFSRGQELRVLDIGGTHRYWETVCDLCQHRLNIEALNLSHENLGETFEGGNVRVVATQGDATKLGSDRDYDLVYSNSVIEHLGTLERMQEFASSATRLGSYFIVQTPNRYFPIEPHYAFPYAQFLPVRARARLGQLWHQGFRWRSFESALEHARELRLLSEAELLQLFPKGTIHRERAGGLVKSIIVSGAREGRAAL